MNLKQKVGIKAVDYVEDGMVVGLGTGSTAYFMIQEIGRRINEKTLNIVGVATSKGSEVLARELNIPLKDINDVPYIDVTIDGADEFDSQLRGIKGGGGALLFEKIVSNMSKKTVWIVDSSKHVGTLGKFPLPVEVIPFGSQAIFVELALKGYHPEWRMKENDKYLTDSGNYIIDLHIGVIRDPEGLAEELDHMTGVIEHGLFLNQTDVVIMSSETGIEVINR